MTTFNKFPSLVKISLLAFISVSVYLFASYRVAGIGFPLDDAWIHQTYSRNLSSTGEWSFLPGYLSAGSTSPLWTIILTVGYLFGLQPFIWTYFAGWICLVLIGYYGSVAFLRIIPTQPHATHWVSVLLVLEWHLVWAAVSGMETIFLSLIILIVMTLLLNGKFAYGWLGILIGLSVWIRPDGITLVAPVLFVMLLNWKTQENRIRNLFVFSLNFLLLFFLYLLFNKTIAGSWWPNTFYAKQAEYAVELLDPLWMRIMEQVKTPLIGVGIILLPGFVLQIIDAFKKRSWPVVMAGLWVIGFLGLYAVRLPVVYQHGRYIMPVLPIYLVIGSAGMAGWVKHNHARLIRRVISKSWTLAGIITLVLYWIMGVGAYSQDVGFIQTEMVSIARWVADNTEPEDLIAAHDIGALGYFSNRNLLDLAGLISPQVIPFIRDENRLAKYIDDQQVDYLVTFPSWYPNLVKHGVIVYTSGGTISRRLGGENMFVYRWLTEP